MCVCARGLHARPHSTHGHSEFLAEAQTDWNLSSGYERLITTTQPTAGLSTWGISPYDPHFHNTIKDIG